jgi:small redox-active disulfide protein 2
MIKIKILGSDCTNCKRLETQVRKMIAEKGMEAEIEKVTDYAEFMKWRILSLPGLVINDQLISAGRIPSAAELALLFSV